MNWWVESGRETPVRPLEVASIKGARDEPEEDPIEAARVRGREEGRAEAEREFERRRREIAAEAEQKVAAEVAELKAHAEPLASALAEAEAEVRRRSDLWVSDVRANVLALATAAARRFVARAVEEHPDLLEEVVEDAVSSLGEATSGPVVVHLNPEDLAAVEDLGLPASHPDLEWAADSDISRGGCRVSTDGAWVERDVEKGLADLYRRLGRA